jgi:prepilin signal peptidase PulO-like enzyme (type II secretory pathway)
VADHSCKERTLTTIIMAIFGVVAGFVVDELAARMAREPYQRDEAGSDELRFASESAQLSMTPATDADFEIPRLLTTASWYRRAIVVSATALAFAIVGHQYEGSEWRLMIAAFYVAALIICAATDVLSYRVPNAITYPAIIGALLIGMFVPGANRLDVLAGGLLYGGILFLPSILTGAMGMGDAKLALFVGFALGLTFAVPAMLIMAISGGLAAAILIVTRLRGRGDPIPYAPFIAGGALVMLLIRGTAFFQI